MAQHSHCVYGNIYPGHHFYQKNKSNQNQNFTNNNINNNNKKNQPKPSSSEKNPNGRFPVFSALPFSNRNGKLHRSNPHLYFSGQSKNEIQNHQKAHSNLFQSKWRNEISNAANIIPRKWCDFVFRRNTDNQLYRSESFRFIQKTNSLHLLPPLSAGLNKYRNKRLQEVPVSEDYVEPLDHVVGSRLSPQESAEGWKKSTSIKAGPVTSEEDDDTPYNEIIESYNAPYYYSDTIKEPTYCSPCPSWRQSCGDFTVQEKSSPSSSLSSPPPTAEEENKCERVNYQRSKSSRSGRFRNRSGCGCSSSNSSGTSMARKRYETAFIPSSSHHPTQSPDVDSLLLAIETCSLVRRPEDFRHEEHFENTHNREGNRVEERQKEDDDRVDNCSVVDNTTTTDDRERQEVIVVNNIRIRRDPSISYCQSMNQSHSITHTHNTSGSTTTTNSSPLSDKKPKLTMPLSEPLPQKRYSNMTSSSSCSSGPSTSTSLTSCRPSDKRLLMTMMKDNSVSSLESIDSTKSEDLQSFSRPFAGHRGGSHYGHFGRQGTNSKLLSPISDKSPLEPSSLLQSSIDGNEVHGSTVSAHHNHNHHHEIQWPNYQMSAAELTNVPWDMPKLKRRLALLADSGISLDCPGYPHGESGHFSSGSGDRDREAFDMYSKFQYTSSHIPGNPVNVRVTQHSGDCVENNSSKTQNEPNKLHNSLHLNFDNGLVQDEYYEDPRLNVNEQTDTAFSNQTEQSNSQATSSKPNKPSSNWVTNVTSVQVHVSSSGTGPSERGGGLKKPDRCRMKLDFRGGGNNPFNKYEIDPTIELEAQEWFHGAITRCEAEGILRATKEGSFLVRNCESSSFNRYSLSLKSARGFIHIRIEPNSLGTFSLGEQDFPSVPHLVLHFMCHRLPIKGAEHVKLMYPVITQLL